MLTDMDRQFFTDLMKAWVEPMQEDIREMKENYKCLPSVQTDVTQLKKDVIDLKAVPAKIKGIIGWSVGLTAGIVTIIYALWDMLTGNHVKLH